MLLHECSECGSEVKYGSKYCSECGIKLVWPKNNKVVKNEKTKTRISRSKKDTVMLPVSPERLFKLLPKKYGWLDSPYKFGVLFCANGGLIVMWLADRRIKKIEKWIERLKYEDGDISFLVKKVRSIRRCAIFAIILTIIDTFYLHASIFYLCNYYGVSGVITAILLPILVLIGLGSSIYFEKICGWILSDIEKHKMYKYQFSDFRSSIKMASPEYSIDNCYGDSDESSFDENVDL